MPEYKNCIICQTNEWTELNEKERDNKPVKIIKCNNCGLTETISQIKNYKKYYEKESRKQKIITETPEFIYKNGYDRAKAIIEILKKRAGLRKENKVLDVGCGAGGIVSYFKEQGYETKGIDLDETFLEYGKKKGTNIEKATTKDLLEKEERFDIVLYVHVLEHIEDAVQELFNAKRLLNRDGAIFVEVPLIENAIKRYGEMQKYFWIEHIHNFSHKDIFEIANICGLKVTHWREGGYFILKK